MSDCLKAIAAAVAFIALLLGTACAAPLSETRDNVRLNEPMILGGKTLTVLSASREGSLKVDVDGTESVVSINSNLPSLVNGMEIRVKGYTYVNETYSMISLEITVPYFCGDGKCEEGEKKSCCKDCGCESGYSCRENACRKNFQLKSAGSTPCLESDCTGMLELNEEQPKNPNDTNVGSALVTSLMAMACIAALAYCLIFSGIKASNRNI